MFQIPWQEYSEEEIQEALTLLYRERRYEVYNLHKTDRRGEEGADLECTRPGETGKILIAAKKKPQQKDIQQLNTLANRTLRTKIYVYIGEPSASFRKAMQKVKDKVSFWNSEKLTHEFFTTDVRFYLFMIIENTFERDSYDITFSFAKFYLNLEEEGPKFRDPVKADEEMLNLLWQAKDRSVSLHKSLRTLQTLFEEMKLPTIDEGTKESITDAFLNSLFQLHANSLKPLNKLFHQFLSKYPANFETFCIQTKGRSNWLYIFNHLPQLSPRYIRKTLEKGYEAELKVKDFISRTELYSKEADLAEVLGDVSRILANDAFILEDTVDDLLSIGLFGKWDALRERFPGPSFA